VSASLLAAVALIVHYALRLGAWPVFGAGIFAVVGLSLWPRQAKPEPLPVLLSGVAAACALGVALATSAHADRLAADDAAVLFLAVMVCGVAPGATASLRSARGEPAGSIILLRFAAFQAATFLVVGVLLSGLLVPYAMGSPAHVTASLLLAVGLTFAMGATAFNLAMRSDLIGISTARWHLEQCGVRISTPWWGYRFEISGRTVRRPWIGPDTVGHGVVVALCDALNVPPLSLSQARQLAGEIPVPNDTCRP